MRIGVLSDSHANSIDRIPKRIVDELSGVDLIVHAGDYTGKTLLEELRKLGNFKGVYGNMDSPEIKQQLPALETIDAGGFRIGINHPAEGGSALGIEERIRAKFPKINAIVFGHTHRAKNEYVNGVLYFNPGSATGTFPAVTKTFGIIRVEGEVTGEIIRL
jgi:hypothetical protein